MDVVNEGLAQRLRDLAADQAARTSPWPGVTAAVRRDRRRRAGGLVGLVAVGVTSVALAVPVLAGSPAAPTVRGPGGVSGPGVTWEPGAT